MNFDYKLATLALAVCVNACGGQPGEGSSPDHDDDGAEAGGRDAGGPQHSGDSGGIQNESRAGAANVAGTANDADTANDAGTPDDNVGGASGNGESNAGGADSNTDGDANSDADDDGDAAGAPGDSDGNTNGPDNGAGGSDDDGGFGGSPGSSGSHGLAGRAGSGGSATSAGSGGVANAGSGSVSSNAGSGSVPANAGSGGVAANAGSGGVAPGAGSGGISSMGGSGGAMSAGAGGNPNDAGSGGVPATAGSGGSAGKDDGSSLDPEYLYTQEQFGGNGRTCVTCHSPETGTINPSQVQALYAADPEAPLFRRLDSDDGASDVYTQLRERATFRVTIALPPGVFITSDPNARSVTVRRGVPSTINTPALDPVLMWDGRAPDLVAQALDAVLGHAEGTVTPTPTQLELITQFEKGPDFFSSELLRQYSQGGPAPTWPAGVTPEEQRGRRWFAQDSAAPRFNLCGQCHGGPMTNETQANSGLPVGKHFQTVDVSELNTLGNPVYEFSFPDPNDASKRITFRSPDPGRALITGDARDRNFFKIPTLWGVAKTAPYFHDNSARTLEELMDHYEQHFAKFLRRNASYPTPHVPTAQDKADIIAYLKLL